MNRIMVTFPQPTKGVQTLQVTACPKPYYIVWCGSPSHRYFCTIKIGYPVLLRSLIPLAKTPNLMRGDDWLEEIQIGSKLTEV